MDNSSNRTHETITIEGHDIQALFYKDQPVITLKMMDQVHERPEGTAKRNFRLNKDRFIENEDFFRLRFEEYKGLTTGRNSSRGPDTGQRNPKVFLTAMGYMLLVKSFTDDRAWKVQRALAKKYFQSLPASSALQIESRTARVKMKNDSKKQQITYAKNTMEIESIAKKVAERICKGRGKLEDYAITPELYDLIRTELDELNKDSLFPKDQEE